VVSGLKTAQGLTEDAAGNLLVTENAAGRVDAVLLTFKLVPQPGVAALTTDQPLCVEVARAPGFSGPVRLQPGQGYRVVRQPEGDQAGEVLADRCTDAPCSI